MATNCNDDFDWTREELNALKDAFKDKKFLQMLNEYAEEVTDPENVRKYESDVIAYERQHGNEVKFIHPEGGYVLKTSVEGERKAFINICTNSNVEKPSFQSDVSDGMPGARWWLPHFLTPPRDDLDKSKRRCVVYDVIFHPNTIKLAENERFRKMINDIAIEEIENKFSVTMDKNNIRFPKMKYKGNPVATLTRKKLEAKDSPGDLNEDGLDDNLRELLKPPSRSYNYNKSSSRKNERNITENKFNESENDSTWSIPKYAIKYRNHIDIQDYSNVPHQTVSTRPQEIIVDINLPLLNSASHLSLDITEKNLLLVSEKKGANYKLDLSLAYPVDQKEGKAQFDKSKSTLTVTLKVLPASNLDLFEDKTHISPNNCTQPLDLSDLQHCLDNVDEENQKDCSDVISEAGGKIESSSNALWNYHSEEKIDELSEESKDSLILPIVSNAQNELDSELSEIMEKMDEKLHMKESENLIDEITTETNDNVRQSSVEHIGSLDALLEETDDKYEPHDCSKNPPLSEVAYFPRFDFHQTSEAVIVLVEVKNIDASSIQVQVCECRTKCWIMFFTLGSGFVPFHYSLFLDFGSYLIAEGAASVNSDLNENNLVIHLLKDCNNHCAWTEFEAGINNESLQKYEFLCEENIMKAIEELKDETEAILNGDSLLNEHVHVEDVSEEKVTFDINVEKLCNLPENHLENVTENIEEEIMGTFQHISTADRNQNDFQAPAEDDLCDSDEFKMLPSSPKVRTSSGSSEDQSPTQKRPGILKYPRYWRTVSESSDDMFWSSMDNEATTPVGSLDSLGERPKKCVRFNDQVAKNVFRANSSILGQRKKNQRKARNRKKSNNSKSNSDGTTETSEEASDCNSASESTSDVIHASTWNQKAYAAQQCINIDADMTSLSENVSNDSAVYCTMGMSDIEIFTHSTKASIYSSHPSTALNSPAEDFCAVGDNSDSLVEHSEQSAEVLGDGKSKTEEPKFTIMQQPRQVLTIQQPLDLQQSEQSNANHSYSKSLKRTTNSARRNDNKASRSNKTAFQKQDNSHGETKQKGRRRRRWRNKNGTKSALNTFSTCNQEPSYSILKSPNNFPDPEQLPNCGERKLSEQAKDGNQNRCNDMFTENIHNCNNNENVGDIITDVTSEKSTNSDHFWQCKNNTDDDDAQYRTNCIVDFTNELMFQLD